MLLAPAAFVPVCAETTQQAAVIDGAKADKPAAEKSGQGATAQAGESNPAPPTKEAPPTDQIQPAAQPKSLTEKAIDKVKQVAKSAD